VLFSPWVRDISVDLMLGIYMVSLILLSVYKVIKYRKLCEEEKKNYNVKSDIIFYLIMIILCIVIIIIR